MSATIQDSASASNENEDKSSVSQLSKELVIGLVGYAGAGCSTVASRVRSLLEAAGYQVLKVKVSDLIVAAAAPDATLQAPHRSEGDAKFERGRSLQGLGDDIRGAHGDHALSALAVGKIIELRGKAKPGEGRIAFILDSVKHPAEVALLRRVYDTSFRLVAVHCERPNREARLIGTNKSMAKFKGVPAASVRAFMDRDEKDGGKPHGQQVRDTFHIADFFLDNNSDSPDGASLTGDIDRFVSLLLGTGLVRPTKEERAMYVAHAAALQSACLSRQVGAALTSADGTVIATGTNEVPRFGGGVYEEGSTVDHRCFAWEFSLEEGVFRGCHNQRRKNRLREDIAAWLADNLADRLSLAAHPVAPSGMDAAKTARERSAKEIRAVFTSNAKLFEGLPGLKDLIEYSRSIHAEMNALLSAGRSGTPAIGSSLYCTTYPCHNCARHLVTAGVARIFYIEPYVKSLASELHSDSIANGAGKASAGKMTIMPFTGVGPRLYEDLFAKRGELKDGSGRFLPPEGGVPAFAVRLEGLATVEMAAAALVPARDDG
jgi:deoxycytidylate deaminase